MAGTGFRANPNVEDTYNQHFTLMSDLFTLLIPAHAYAKKPVFLRNSQGFALHRRQAAVQASERFTVLNLCHVLETSTTNLQIVVLKLVVS